MMNWIIGWSQKFRLLVVTVAAVMMFIGITQMPKMPVDVLPEFSLPYVEVQTEALGLSAIEVEQLITTPLEADLLNGVAWLKTIRSESIPGLSSVVLIFEPGTDVMRARQMVQERLTQAHALPNVSKPPVMLQPLSSTNRVMKVGLTSEKLSPIQMSVLARWTIKPRLMGVSGVANVAIWGQRKRQLQVQVNPEHLKQKGVTLHQIIKTAGEALWVSPLTFLNASTPGTGGWIDTPNQRLGVRHLLPITTPEQLAKVPVEGKEMLLGDVAKVVEGHQLLIGDSIVNDGPGLLLVIEKFPWSNTLDVTRGVEKALDSLRPGLSGIEIDSNLFRPATFIELSITNLATAFAIGCGLLIIALFAFFHNWRVALISLAAILLSVTAAVLVLYLRGVTVNAMVLAGLVLALVAIIDDAIIDVENIARRLSQHRREGGDKSTARIMLDASLEMRSAVVYATLIIMLAVVPVYFLDGLFGAFLQPLAFSYVLALLASMLVALTVTPALSLKLLGDAPIERSVSPLIILLQRGYRAVASRTVRPIPGFAVVGVIALAGIFVWPQLGQSLLPSFKGNTLLIKWEGTPGTSRSAMNRIVTLVGRELRAIPEVRNVSAHVGRAVMSDKIVGVSSSQLWVSLDSAADHDVAVAKIQQVVDGYPGVDGDVLTYTEEKTREALKGADDELVVRVYGHDLKVIHRKAEEVREALTGIKGVVDPQVEHVVEEPTLEIKVDLAKAEGYGIKPGDVRRATTTLMSGIQVGSLFEEQKVFDVVVWSTPETRHSLTSVNALLIDTPRGEHVRLKDVADVRIAPAPNVIKREGVARHMDVKASVRGRNFGSVVADVDRSIKAMDFPLEHHAEVLGGYEERQATLRRVRDIAIAAAIGIFLLLQAAFGSWRLATVAFLTLPMALAGGALAAFVSGGILSLGSLVGFIAVFAIAARNGILLIRHFQHLEKHENETFGLELVMRGIQERFAPILMTAATAGLVLLPLVYFGNLAGHEIVYPMAVVILGGLVTATLVNLFVLPALYLRFGSGLEPALENETQKMGVS